MSDIKSGWWLFDPAARKITHSVTGQTLSFSNIAATLPGIVPVTNKTRQWMLFVYEDSDLTCPLLIEWRKFNTGDGKWLVNWRVDYARTARLHDQEQKKYKAAKIGQMSYAIWKRLDEFLIDALPFWGAANGLGPAPVFIAFNAGWMNGSWTEAFYRVSGKAPEYPYNRGFVNNVVFQTPVSIPLDLTPPSPWRIAPTGSFTPVLDANLPAALREEVASALQARPCLVAGDGERYLVGLPISVDDVRTSSARIFYCDSDLATDMVLFGLHGQQDNAARSPPPWSIEFAPRTSVLFDRRLGGAVSCPQYRKEDPGGFVFDAIYAPLSIERKLADFCRDGLLFDRQKEWTPFGDAMTTGGCSEVRLESHCVGGTESRPNLDAAVSLDDPLVWWGGTLRSVFDETSDDGILHGRASVMIGAFWEYDPPSTTLWRRLTGQSLSLVGRDPDRALSFLYRDPDGEYPLRVVQERILDTGSIRFLWTLDHVRSAALWRAREEMGDLAVPYGLWRRVDDCVIDALLCWPDTEEIGQKPVGLKISGGWFNGAWLPALRRYVNPVRRDSVIGKSAAHAPFVERLDAVAPSWIYIDAPVTVDAPIRLSGEVKLDRSRFYLPESAELSGFEGRMPAMRRNDGGAVVLPSESGSYLLCGVDYRPIAQFLYADENAFFYLAGDPFDRKTMKFDLHRLFNVGTRRASVSGHPDMRFAEDYIPTSRLHSDDLIPAPALLQRARNALLDAMLVWPGTSSRLRDEPGKYESFGTRSGRPDYEHSGVSLSKFGNVTVESGYIGGCFSQDLKVSAWIETD
ncbi:hypothetical protein [Brytella acorum]|uniref:Uncharacterized protein n=1 Tax=Brytella acorum TaxID=2959299 RepID=A0AA35V9F3_9PROT|nr:hypothetical protein [Brytella acorum]MDF3624878.1 hypothetical protein [Brytella acorum]CAI9120183.1 hypothetical protein LMG32879_001013 [Brytella acorum]